MLTVTDNPRRQIRLFLEELAALGTHRLDRLHLKRRGVHNPLGRVADYKRDLPLRNAILYMLDVLVESGSSYAFRMRDQFVMPAA